MLTFREFLKEKLKNPEFKKEWDALESEREETLRRLRAERVKEKSGRVFGMQNDEVSVAVR